MDPRELYQFICDELDGSGLAVTDCELLAETIAECLDVTPGEVNPDYQGEE